MSTQDTPEVTAVSAQVQRLCEQVLTGSELEWRLALVELALLNGRLELGNDSYSTIIVSPFDAGKVQ